MSELYHYGVLGMKWGVRRRQPRLVKKKTMKAKNRLEKNNGEGAIKVQNRIDKMTTKMLNTKRGKRMLERINSINSQSATVKNGKNYADDFFQQNIHRQVNDQFMRQTQQNYNQQVNLFMQQNAMNNMTFMNSMNTMMF